MDPSVPQGTGRTVLGGVGERKRETKEDRERGARFVWWWSKKIDEALEAWPGERPSQFSTVITGNARQISTPGKTNVQ